MGTSNKQKRAFRVRQKMANRQPSKISQIRQLLQMADEYEKSIYGRKTANQKEK